MSENPDFKVQAKIIEKWKTEMADMMETTQDLIQCVANDIVETNSSCGSSVTSMTSQDLGKILEEELFEDDTVAKKVFLVRTQKKKRKPKRKPRSRNSRDRRDSSEIEIDGKVWHSQNTFTIQVDEIDNLSMNSNDVMTGSWQWRKDLDSPMVWDADDASVENDDERKAVEVEDIFSDWLNMQKKKKIRKARAEINEVFWNISLEPRQRRISQVLDNLPFSDHPDVFSDRCELLEGSKLVVKKKKKERPKMSYWNIFNQWKRNLNEENLKEKKPKSRKTKPRRRGRTIHKETRGGTKKKGAWFKRPRRNSIHVIEDYFYDFLREFDDSPKRRRFSMDIGSESIPPQERSPKRQKIGVSKYKENWELVRVESNKSFDRLTRNIEKKIREAFKTDKEAVKFPSDLKEPVSKITEDFERWPKTVARKMRKSRRKFTKLRIKVQKVREAKKLSRETEEPADFLQDWKWNLEEKETPEDIFADGIYIFADPTPAEVSPTRRRRMTYTIPSRGGRFYKPLPPPSAPRSKPSQLIPMTTSAIMQSSSAVQKTNCSEDNQHNLRRINRHKADKFANRLRMRCQAKQPLQRGRNI